MDYRERRYFLCRFDGYTNYDPRERKPYRDIDLIKSIKSVKIHKPYYHFKNSEHPYDADSCSAVGYVQNMISVRNEDAQQLVDIIQSIKSQSKTKDWCTNCFEITKEVCGQ